MLMEALDAHKTDVREVEELLAAQGPCNFCTFGLLDAQGTCNLCTSLPLEIHATFARLTLVVWCAARFACAIAIGMQGGDDPDGALASLIFDIKELVTLAEQEETVSLHFNSHLADVDFDTTTLTFKTKQGEVKQSSDLIFGADGAFSKVRRKMQEIPRKRISYSLDYMPQSYIELTIPAAADGSHQLEKEALHIWPRKDFMLIALPNPDGSFTCTLFMNQEGDISFDALQQRNDVKAFFQTYFSDALDLLDDPIGEFMSRAASPLSLVHIYPWVVNDNVGLIGDAAHAMVPFYGQGMNCGFEDCRVLNELVSEHKGDWSETLSQYQRQRKPNGDAIIELAKRNFVEMSELSGDANFQLCKKIEANFHNRYPDLWVPLYSMVTFSPHTPYSDALRVGDIQKDIMSQIMVLPNIHERWQDEDIYEQLHALTLSRNLGGNT
jgi:kynurenine 3-monooxygenase